VTDDDAEVSMEHQSGEMEMEGIGHGRANQQRVGMVLARRSADRSKVVLTESEGFTKAILVICEGGEHKRCR